MFRSILRSRTRSALASAALAGAVLVPTLAACNAAHHDAASSALSRIHAAAPSSAPAKKNPCVGQFVIVVANDPLGCDVTPPQVIIERHPGSDDIEADKFLPACDDMGGELVWTNKWSPDHEWEFACEGVDY